MGTDITSAKRDYKSATGGLGKENLALGFYSGQPLRYGENPNQRASVFQSRVWGEVTVPVEVVKQGKNGLSATNFMDLGRAVDVLKYFSNPSVAVMKHLIPSGVATTYGDRSQADNYIAARDADARSAFGSVVVSNHALDMATAEAIMSTYVEVVAAPGFEEGVLKVFSRKKDLRVAEFSGLDKLPKFIGDEGGMKYDLKVLPTGHVIIQAPYLSSIRSASDVITDATIKSTKRGNVEVARQPTEREMNDMLTAWYVNIGTRSNGIVLVKNGVTLAVGSGQQERVGAVEQAIVKAYQKAMDREGIDYQPLFGIMDHTRLGHNPLKGAVASSDAFFPFRDSIDTLAQVGISAVIQPGGSRNDRQVIEAVNEHRMAMGITLEGCFGHF